MAMTQTNFGVRLFSENLAECPKIRNAFSSRVITGIVKGILSAPGVRDHEAETRQPCNTANRSSLLRDVLTGMKPGRCAANILASLH